jgi:hypothetical protein
MLSTQGKLALIGSIILALFSISFINRAVNAHYRHFNNSAIPGTCLVLDSIILILLISNVLSCNCMVTGNCIILSWLFSIFIFIIFLMILQVNYYSYLASKRYYNSINQ